jgi:hypothetical protein
VSSANASAMTTSRTSKQSLYQIRPDPSRPLHRWVMTVQSDPLRTGGNECKGGVSPATLRPVAGARISDDCDHSHPRLPHRRRMAEGRRGFRQPCGRPPRGISTRPGWPQPVSDSSRRLLGTPSSAGRVDDPAQAGSMTISLKGRPAPPARRTFLLPSPVRLLIHAATRSPALRRREFLSRPPPALPEILPARRRGASRAPAAI